MLTPQAGRLRLARAAVVAGTTLGLSLGAHLVAGGAAPAGPVLACVAVFTLLTCIILADRRFTPVRLLITLGLGQVALHTVFSWLGTTACATPPAAHAPGSGARAAHHLPDAVPDLSACLAPGAASSARSTATEALAHAAHLGSGAPDAPAAVTMLVAHVVATLLVAALVARGERALWLAAEVLVAGVRGTRLQVALLVVSAPALAAVRTGHPVRPLRVRHHCAAPRRGPPRDLLLAA